MKRRILIRKLVKAGFILERHGSDHDVYKRGTDKEEIPRHREINELLAKDILRKWGIN
ncbi:MAG: type II toxin-antitoxin system HicA family toxin [Lachnospiraceae bacterium]|nr:type II toxin-antitoxin system HicA family toxin [Lachnospiraceae bacterium]